MYAGGLRDKVVAPIEVDKIFREIKIWLKFNGVSIIDEKEPEYIKGHWKGNLVGSAGESLGSRPQTSLNQPVSSVPFAYDLINDPFEKSIEVRIDQHFNGSSVEFYITQLDPRHRDKGLVYWGIKLESLYEALGIEYRDMNLQNLYRSRVDREIDKLRRNYSLLFLSSLIIVLLVCGFQLDIFLTYCFLVVMPLAYFYWTTYGVYNDIRSRIK